LLFFLDMPHQQGLVDLWDGPSRQQSTLAAASWTRCRRVWFWPLA
jgi:hypothetical protein